MKRMTMLLGLLAAASLAGGCGSWMTGQYAMQSPATAAPSPAAAPAAPAEATPAPTYLKDMVRGNADTPTPSAVDSAMVWAQKYTEATERIVRLEKDNQALVRERDLQNQQLAKLNADLAQSRKEIDDANSLILQTRQELARWKADVLGFRDAISQSQQAIMESQLKILKLLGGEVPTQASTPTTQPSGVPVAAGQGQTR